MKLRQRIIITVLSITGFSGLLTVLFTNSLYEYQVSKSHVPSFRWSHLSPEHPVKSSKTTLNYATIQPTAADSDRAEEVEAVVNDTLWLPHISLLPVKRKRKKAKKAATHEDLIRSCSEPFPVIFDEQEDGAARFPDLVRLLFKQSRRGTDAPGAGPSLQELLGITDYSNLTNSANFYLQIRVRQMYSEGEPLLDKVLHDMSKLPIVNAEEKVGGTQLKLVLTFEDGSQALMKPMRFDRAKETDPNHFYFVDFERHISEIAAFHLDRILGFRRSPPVVGRLLNITSEIYAFASTALIRTFFVSPANNLCFHGRCSYYCDTGHAICGNPDMLEGSLAMFLPPKNLSPRKTWPNPWKRSYHKRRRAEWETNDDYCESVRKKPPYDKDRRLADVIDMAILDFLIGNMDRHHYETFKLFGNDSFILHLDHGRGFGKSGHDELSILAPLYQCCFLRFQTFRKLLELHYGTKPLSYVMRCSLSRDPVDPVLLEKHLSALDRRLLITLEVIRDCLKRHSPENVIYHENSDIKLEGPLYE